MAVLMSKKMPELIYSNITVELGYVYKFGSIHDIYMNAPKNSKGIASEYASAESAVKGAISAYLTKLDG